MADEIKLTTILGRTRINKDNFAESMRSLEKILRPGTPIMFQNYHSSSLHFGGRHAQRILFFSGGRLSKKGVFNLQKGRRNFCYAQISEKDPAAYDIIIQPDEELNGYNIKVPRSWTRQQYNEETFSPAGPHLFSSLHSEGTEQIIAKDSLARRFPDAMRALRFARDSVYFNLNSFYAVQNHEITEIGDTRPDCEQEKQRSLQTNRIACVRAVMNLLTEATREIEIHLESLVTHQIGWFSCRARSFRAQRYPVDDDDYLIQATSQPYKDVAFVKIGGGMFAGEIYVLPVSRDMDQLVERAFSADMVKKHYPHGCKEKEEKS